MLSFLYRCGFATVNFTPSHTTVKNGTSANPSKKKPTAIFHNLVWLLYPLSQKAGFSKPDSCILGCCFGSNCPKLCFSNRMTPSSEFTIFLLDLFSGVEPVLWQCLFCVFFDVSFLVFFGLFCQHFRSFLVFFASIFGLFWSFLSARFWGYGAYEPMELS